MRKLLVLLILVCSGCGRSAAPVKTGADLLLSEYLHLIEGKRVGLVTNHSGVLSDGRHLADALAATPGVTLAALFGPEHGIRGDAPDGTTIHDSIDQRTQVPVYSLYGSINKPTPEMLKSIDVLLFDIQDVGVRFYTYTSTLSLTMEAAAEQGIPYVVLDRPNPIRGTRVEGFMLEDSLRSFVGLHPIPIAYGMTIGELATLFNGEGWLRNGVRANLTVMRMKGWKRTMWYDETGLRWIKPSPNIATLRTAIVYPGTCLIEGTNISEGRGTERPFEFIGAPFIDGDRWATELNSLRLPGVLFQPIAFTPRSIPNVAASPKHEGKLCRGVHVDVTDREMFEPVRTGVSILAVGRRLFGSAMEWRERSIDRLSGTSSLRAMVDAGKSGDEIAASWREGIAEFTSLREKYLLY